MQVDGGPRQRVRHQGIVQRAVSPGLLVQPGQVGLVDDLLLEREVGAALVGQRRTGHGPALPLDPHDVLRRHEHVGQENLVELGVARHLHERAHVDARIGHVDDQRGDPLLGAGRIDLGAGQAQAPGGELGVGRPDLAARHLEAPLDRRGPRGEGGQVAAGVGLAEELAPDLPRREDGRQVAQPLVLGAVGQECRAHQVDADPVDGLRGLGPGVLALVESDLHRRGTATAIGAGPVDTHPAVGRHGGLPLPAPGHLVGQVDEGGRAAQVIGQPRPERGGEFLVLLVQREIHARSLTRPDIGVTLSGPGYGALP